MGPLWAIFRVGVGFKTVLGSAHVAEYFSFSLFLSILTFDFDLILGSFLTFGGPNGLFLGLGKDSNTFLGSKYVVEQLSFSMFSSILTFDFTYFMVIFLVLGALTGYFWGWGRVQQLIWG